MVTTKKGKLNEYKSLWDKNREPIKADKFFDDTADTEKIIVYGESSAGKTTFYLGILSYLKSKGVKKEDICMCIIYPDRPTGLKKLRDLIPKEFLENIYVFPINTYEELVESTATAEKYLDEHYKKTGKYGWLVVELLEEAWKMSQDYYTRKAYGENLGDYFAEKQQITKAVKEDSSAYSALQGWKDWSVIKFQHNFNWIDKIKRMQYNTVFTAEIKEEGNKDSIFYEIGYRPAGEKDNMHRVDTILHLSHRKNQFAIQPFKLTGYQRLYNQVKVTGKNPYRVHIKALEKLAEMGYKTSAIEELEKEANVKPPQKPEKKAEKKPAKKEEKKEEKPKKEEKKQEEGEDIDWDFE